MKILNISSIIPLPKLKRENDIVLRIQDYLNSKYDFHFTIAKSLPYAPRFIVKFNKKWSLYYNYQKKGCIEIKGYKTIIYGWLMFPTSKFLINYFLIPLNWIWYIFIIKDKFIFKDENFDIIVSQNLIPDAIIAYWLSKKMKKPFIINLRGNSHPNWFKLPLLKSVFNSANAIITHSPTNFKKFREICKVSLIPHPVDDIFFTPCKNKMEHLQVLTVCRLLNLKNIDWVLVSLAKLKQEGFVFDYKIVGDGPELENLKDLVNKLDLNEEVSFLGYLDKESVSVCMHEAHIFIMPSFPETLGRVYLEAAAAKCLIIGHKDTGSDGLFEHEKSAFFVSKNDILKFMRIAMSSFGKDKFDKMTHCARDRVEDLTWDGIGSIYSNLYLESIIE